MMDYPVLVFAVSLFVFWLSAKAGTYWRHRAGKLGNDERADLSVVLTSALTLLALMIGFTFSMAISRYDLRKADEAAEANAFGTEFVRAGLLPADAARRMRELLRANLQERILFYTTRNAHELRRIEAATEKTQNDLWCAVEAHWSALPPAVAALVINGMNDVLNSEAYTQAAWWNRIPIPAWVLLTLIAMCANALLGYTAWRPEGHGGLLLLMPMIVSIAFFLMADIDSPRGGVIRVHPHNLESAARSLETDAVRGF
jgi:hypothetical protein